MSYSVQLSLPAVRALDRLGRRARQRVVGRLEELAADPHGLRLAKKLAGAEGIGCSRAGDCRIFYTLCEAQQALIVLAFCSPALERLKVEYPTVESLERDPEWLTEYAEGMESRLSALDLEQAGLGLLTPA